LTTVRKILSNGTRNGYLSWRSQRRTFLVPAFIFY
jgi:hypothetical protein